MSICKAQCTTCGAVLDVDNAQEACVCTVCGTPFVVAKAINNYTQSTQGQTLEDGIKNGNTFLQLKEWRKAYELFTDLSSKHPHDARTWIGIARAISHEKECHEVTEDMLQAVKDNIDKARKLNLYIADNTWDVYIRDEAERLEKAKHVQEMTRRKLQSEYDSLVEKTKRDLGTVVRLRKARRRTDIGLGLLLLLFAGVLGVLHYLKYLSVVYYLYIALAVGAIGLLLFVAGLLTSPRKASLAHSDVDNIKRTVERIQHSAERNGVEIDTSTPIKTYVEKKHK